MAEINTEEDHRPEIRETPKVIREGNKKYSIVYKGHYLVKSVNPFQFKQIIDKKKGSNPYKNFVANLDILGEASHIDAFLSLLKESYIEAIESPKQEIKPEPEKEVELIETSYEDINPSKLEEITSTTVLSGAYKLRNPLCIQLVGEASTGKKSLCNLFNDKRVVHMSGRITKNALNPGQPAGVVGKDPYSVLRETNGKCWMIPDIGIFLGSGEETLNNFVGILTDVYGTGSSKVEDPSGLRDIKAWFSIFWGMTRKQNRELLPYTSKMGQRFLICEFPTNLEKVYYDQDDRGFSKQNIRKQKLVSHIINTRNKYDSLIEYSEEMKQVAEKFARKIVILKNLFFGRFNERRI